MSILSGYKKVKNYIETGSGKKLLSRWTSSNTVEFNDGKTAQTKVGAIKGITTSTSATETGYAADATTVAALNQSLNAYDTKFANIGITKIEGSYKYLTVISKQSNTITFTFNSRFKQTPFVCATVEHPWADTIQCTIDSCSASKVVIKVYNGSTQNVTVTVHMIAVGYI